MATLERWDAVWLALALDVAESSTCLRANTGAVVVGVGQQPLSIGYNGAPRKAPQCNEYGCLLDPTGRCIRTIHAEANAILTAARYGSELRRATLYATHRPCYGCSLAIRQAGLKRVVFYGPYRSDQMEEQALEMLRSAGMKVVGPVKPGSDPGEEAGDDA
jgi:dCMP deaminase